jgi:hypothetical protein
MEENLLVTISEQQQEVIRNFFYNAVKYYGDIQHSVVVTCIHFYITREILTNIVC